jgi:squalene monooxygenase
MFTCSLQSFILDEIVPGLPSQLQPPVIAALNKDRLRRMPNSFLPASEQGNRNTKEGVVLLGDAWNMRHPLTGAGMTVAFHDVVILSKMLDEMLNNGHTLSDWENVTGVLHDWFWKRKELAATVNVLSVALYDLFGAQGGVLLVIRHALKLNLTVDDKLDVLRTGCFKYFERGGECVAGPVNLLSV